MPTSLLHPGPRLLIGPDGASALNERLPPGPMLVVTDPGVKSLPLVQTVLGHLGEDRRVIVFDAVEPDPSRATLLKALALGEQEAVESVLGIGGGSPMDVAKLAAYLLSSGDELDDIWGVGRAHGRRLPLGLVPTTAGTGSEATPVAVITVEGEEKRGVNSPALIADWAWLDARLTVGMPATLTAATGIDAMVHAIEAYTSAHAKNPMSDMQAREALRLLAANLGKVLAEPSDLAAREAMLLGSHLAGLAFANAPVAGVHALAYPLGGIFHLPHGLTNALMLLPVLRFNMPAARDDYAELAAILDPHAGDEGTQSAAARFVDRCRALLAESGLALRLRDHGVGREDLPRLAHEAMKQTRLLINNPVPISEEAALSLYEEAW